MHEAAKAAAPHAEAILSSPEGRRRATHYITVNYEHIPAELLAHQLVGVATCDAARLIEHAVWGTEDRLLKWPSAAARYRDEWLPHADWIELEGVGHCPQLDVPLEAAQLILGLTAV
jgi:pimeloyl-ACP methyl ester carboxylesterase